MGRPKKQTTEAPAITNNAPTLEEELKSLREARKAFNAKPFKYEDDKLMMLALDVQIGNILLQLRKK